VSASLNFPSQNAISRSGGIVLAREWVIERILSNPRDDPSVVALRSAILLSGHQPANGVGNRSRPIRSRIARNNARGIATSAIWNVTCREWRTTFAPILISFSFNVVSVQCRTGTNPTFLAGSRRTIDPV